MKNRNVLVIVAHPDDETLWFYAGLKSLSENNTVDILCLTFGAASVRGRELLMATKNLNVRVKFGGLMDPGFFSLLSGVEAQIKKVLLQKKYDLIITHPPHGGEKPHPHHIQCFHISRRLAYQRRLQFAFFSEKILDPISRHHIAYNFFEKISQFHSYFIMHSKIGLFTKRSFLELLKAIRFLFTLILTRETYSLITYSADLTAKQYALNAFKSQLYFLEQYKTYNSTQEHLYLQCNTKVIAHT